MPIIPPGLLSDLTSMSPIYRSSANWWNMEVVDAPIDSQNATIKAQIIVNGTPVGGTPDPKYARLHPDFGVNFGIPYCVVTKDTPRESIVWTNDPANNGSASPPFEWDTGFGGYEGYPIPVAARTNCAYMENCEWKNTPGRTGDAHILMLQRDDWWLYELSYAGWNDPKWPGRWYAGYGAIWDLKRNDVRPRGFTSTDAAGLQILPGIPRTDEVLGPDPIRHALRCSIKKVAGYVWPATHTGSSDPTGHPCGMRFRLKQSKNITGYPTPVRKILQAMKTYGLIVADRGGNMYIQGTMDPNWGPIDPYITAFHGITINDFDVIRRGWSPPGMVGVGKTQVSV